MEKVVRSLIDFSITHNLWQTTIKYGIYCLENWIRENRDEFNQLFPELVSSNFRFEEGSQHLIFSEKGSEVFVLRTKYLLFTDCQNDVPVGWFALDVDINGEVIDDWLFFE